MKTIVTILITLLSFNSFTQENSKIWVSFKDKKNIPFLNQKRELISNDLVLNAKIKELNIISSEQVFTSSRNPELLSVYEITCKCDEVELYYQFTKNVKSATGVEYAPKYETLEAPNDYNLINNSNWALNLINAQNAWNYTTSDSSVVIGISDQNYYMNHEELTNKLNYYDGTNTATKTHGTAVAITAAGSTNNDIGLSSIGYNSSLSLYRMNYNDVIQASYNGIRVINMSWASGCSFNPYAQMAIDEVYNNGTFIVASAGNGTTCGGPNSLVYPAAYNHVFAVTSIGSQDNIEKTIGNPNTRHQTNSSVDICAPGFNVPLSPAPGFYTTGNGTSFAAPYVTGTVGLMLSLKSDLTNQEIDSILRLTATNIDLINANYIGKIGSGRLNSGLAVQTVWEMIQEVEDGNNGHGNDADGVDNSNPGQGNGNQGGNGNHFGWDNKEKVTLGDNISSTNVVDINGKNTNLENALPGYYFIVNNGIITKTIYKN
jgi:hypothetical protein